MFHLTVRVAWHDSRWNGSVCREPSRNCFCVALDRIRENRKDEEDTLAGLPWDKISQSDLPPCKAESGVFMNPQKWIREFEHPYSNIKKTANTHGHLKPTKVKIPEYATFAVPFAWMLRSEQNGIDERLPEPLPPDEQSPFESSWVFGSARQRALLKLFFGRLVPEQSLVFFYCKEGQPLGDTFPRLVVGVGRIVSIAPPKEYDVNGNKPSHLMWDGLFRHSIRPDGEDGFLFPYHDYLDPTGDPEEDARRVDLLREIAVPADPAHMRVFSYAAELASSDIALSTLVRCLKAVRTIRKHGIAKGPWERREEWLNSQIAIAWKERGAFPGLGSVLEALGMRLGTALSLEMISSKMVAPDANPWPVVDALLQGKIKPPQSAYQPDLDAVHSSWANLDPERRALLMLLSRIAFTPAQAVRWFDPTIRAKGVTNLVADSEILENPYRMSEVDLGDMNDSPVSVGMVDRGLLPEASIAAKHPVPEPSTISSPNDPRRIRAAIVSTLRNASLEGDALLSTVESLETVSNLDLAHPCNILTDWPTANMSFLDGVVELVDVVVDETSGKKTSALQLYDLKKRENRLRSILTKRATKVVPEVKTEWKKLLVEAITAVGGEFDSSNTRHELAIEEQAIALQQLCSRRLTVLVGRAGTGKTSVMGALMLCEPIAKDGILLLAPTGKARVRLAKAAKAEAMTVAQFLHRLGRYDGNRQRPLFDGKEKYRKEKTVVIDECSMLTMDDMVAVFEALDLAHVQRIILIGDPNQLPPIGVGRPFADLEAFLATTEEEASDGTPLRHSLARLSVEVRTATSSGDTSDTLRLASWFTREPQPVDADRVLSELETTGTFNDLEIIFWENSDELRSRLSGAFVRHLGLDDKSDIAGFDTSLGLDDRGWVPFGAPEGSENWQILSPVRMHSHGIYEINRWIQRQYRSKQLEAATQPWGTCLGDESIVQKDKVIQKVNQWRRAYDGSSSDKYYIANGEVGLVAPGKGGFLNVLFAGRANLRFGYRGSDFPSGAGPLDLAYALTVHKAQGSEFKKVFVILPKNCRLLSRELIYTALTRSRDQLVLLIEGQNATVLFDLTRPERSEVARRNTNLFHGATRLNSDDVPYAEYLIHRTEKGHLVRSKSELVIANMLYQLDIKYEYERVCDGAVEPGRLRPDFSFVTADGDLIIWEHLGMMSREDYRRGWKWKLDWYSKNGFIEGKTLYTSEDDDRGGLDSGTLKKTALAIKALLE